MSPAVPLASSITPSLYLRAPSPHAPRIVIYSHDTMGLGHTRRNMLIGKTLAASPVCGSILMLSGIRQSGAFFVPPGIDFVTLPAYSKLQNGEYSSRDLKIEVSELAHLRAQCIKAAVASFSPDLFIVDNVPRGALDELIPTLEHLADRGETKCVLGLRDVIDDPATVRKQWQQRRNFEAIREYYHDVWIYGDPKIYDTLGEYDFPADICLKSRYTGYLDPLNQSGGPNVRAVLRNHAGKKVILCLVGGGQDGARLAGHFAQTALPPGTIGMIVTGPFMPDSERAKLRQFAVGNPRLIVREFVSDPLPLIESASAVVAMGGYNTVIELLAMEKRVLLIPRMRPRMEQMIRAERLQALDLVDFIEEDMVTAGRISEWLKRSDSPAPARKVVNFEGLKRIADVAADLIGADYADSTLQFSAENQERRYGTI